MNTEIELKEQDLELVVSEKTLGHLVTNAKEIRDMVKSSLPKYDISNYNDDNIAQAKKDKATLNKAAKALNSKRIEIEKEFMKPFGEFKEIVAETVGLIGECSSKIDAMVKQNEQRYKDGKLKDIRTYFDGTNTNGIDFGKVFKTEWLNKKKAKLMSFIGDKGTSKQLRWLNNRRNLWIEDKIHKISRHIVDYCIKHDIGNIVIGLNKGWKQNIELGKKTNQKFVEIPFSKLIDKITYKAKLVGINVQTTEESYTSKVDHLAFEALKKHDFYLGKRKKRGLFQSSIGKLLNADINGAIGIGRKVFGDSFVKEIIDSGFAFNPVKVNIL